MYRISGRSKHCPYHSRYIQAGVWGHGWMGWWNLRCIMCGATAPMWRWILLPFYGSLNHVELGPGPYHQLDPRHSDADLRRFGISEAEIKSRYRDPEWIQRLERFER